MPAVEDELLDGRERRWSETAFLGLRLLGGWTWGVSAAVWPGLGGSHADPIAQLTARGLLEQADGQLRLTTRGLPVANVVFAQFIRD